MKRNIDNILADMIDLEIIKKGDEEGRHKTADALLCEALRLLGNHLDPITEQKINRLVETFEGLAKWYA